MPPSLEQHVVVLTGASSGIGRAAAVSFGARGAKVVLAARGRPALDAAAREVHAAGGTPLVVPTDVAEFEQVQALARAAVERFGRIDTWVNGASVSLYGTMSHLPVPEIARLVQVNLMGQVHGVKAALPVMRAQGGGTIIAISSGLGARAVPLQVPYCASKRAVVGLMEGLRMEERRAGSGVVLTTVLPSSINTPLFDHAPSVMGVRPAPIPPVYDPAVVADALVFAATHPRRDIYIGAAARQLDLLERLSPALADRVLSLGGQVFRRQQRSERDAGQGNLHRSAVTGQGAVRGQFGRFALRRSVYTRTFARQPTLGPALVLLAAVLAARRLRASGRAPVRSVSQRPLLAGRRW
ncbi:MAG: SDR family oxidoreductase [Actinomycetota bacterium]|nr:SDR family oxidoreductase [Actinomycetota bacterium]